MCFSITIIKIKSTNINSTMSITNEPILKENPGRFVLFPIEHDDIWSFYKKCEASFWTAEEIDLASGCRRLGTHRLHDDEKHFIKHVCIFCSQ
jgi:ribonucleoside-diphosphate reductase beta chain